MKFKNKKKKKNSRSYTLKGTVDHVNKKYAFIEIDEFSEDIKIRSRFLKGAIHGDKVEVKKAQVKPAQKVVLAPMMDQSGRVQFGPTEDEQSEKGQLQLLESVCVQHEIDHLDGILITDSIRAYNIQRVSEKKYGRNDKVMVKSPDGETDFMKYKKAVPLLEKGYQIV